MKFFKHSFALAAFVCGLILAGCNPEPAGEKFGFVTGDYAVYETVEVDSAGRAVSPAERSSRTVLRTNLSIGGRNDAAEIVDTIFTPGAPPQVQRSYLRVSNDELFSYIDTAFVVDLAAGFATVPGAPTIQGFTPRWVKSGELKDAAGTQDFPEETITFATSDPLFGNLNITARFTGRNLGRTSLTANNTTYQVHRQTQTATVGLSILGTNISVPVTTTYNYGIPSTGAPRAMIQSESRPTTVSIGPLGTIPVQGFRKTLVSFTPGR